MKVEKHILETEEIQLQRQVEAKKELKFIGQVKMERGQKFYQLDMQSKMITVANVDAVIDIHGNLKRKIVTKDECLYVPAINLKNAERKFIKMLS